MFSLFSRVYIYFPLHHQLVQLGDLKISLIVLNVNAHCLQESALSSLLRRFNGRFCLPHFWWFHPCISFFTTISGDNDELPVIERKMKV